MEIEQHQFLFELSSAFSDRFTLLLNTEKYVENPKYRIDVVRALLNISTYADRKITELCKHLLTFQPTFNISHRLSNINHFIINFLEIELRLQRDEKIILYIYDIILVRTVGFLNSSNT